MSNHRAVSIKAKGGSITAGQKTVTGNIPEGSSVPEVSVSGDHPREDQPGGATSSMSLDIEAVESDISYAHDTAVHVNVTSSGDREQQLSDPQTSSPYTTDSVPLSPTVSVTGDAPSGATNLHFFVHERGRYIQIGQCCVVVEMHVNEGLMERLKREGTLEVDTHTGASVVTLRWRGIEDTEEILRTRIKVELTSSLTESLQALERTVLADLVNNRCDKCRTLVTYLLQEVRGRLADISMGCFQLTVLFTSKEELVRGTSSESIQSLQKFLENLLVTEKMQEVAGDVRFSVTVLSEEATQSYEEDQRSTTLYSREDRKSGEKDPSESNRWSREISELKSFLSYELTTMRAGQAREIMTQEQLARQIGAQIQQSMTEELDQFRQRQVQILRDAMTELMPELQQRLYENVATKLQGTGISSQQAPHRGSHQSEESVQHHSEEALSKEERISHLVSFVQAKVPQVLSEVKVRQRIRPVDFSAFFSAIQGLRDKEESEKDEGYIDSHRAGLHDKLMKILGEDGIKVVQRSMERATEAVEKLDKREIPDQFCTVLCLDLSHSMAGNPLKQQIREAEKIVQNCLGQIAVIAIGDKTRVEQDLTQDKDTVKKILEQLYIQPYSQTTSTPVIQGLLTALKLLHLRVKPTAIGHHHTLYPKIVIMSDGLFNDCSPENENNGQSCSKTDNLFASVLEVMAALNIHVPIYFVPVGDKLDPSPSWVDLVTVVKDVDFLSDSMATETLTGRVLLAIMEPKEAQTPAKSWQTIKKDLKKKHDTKEINKVEWFITKHFKNPPPIGTRVKIAGIESQPTGTILQHIRGRKEEHNTKSKYVLVVLDTGDKMHYQWTFDQEELLFYKSSPDSRYAVLPVGTLVRRGKHWNYDNQDGGPDEIGVVIINKEGGRLVKVCWRSHLAARELNVYRYGDQERFDIEIAEPPLIDLAGLIDSEYPRWLVGDGTGKWEPVTGISALQLEEGMAQKKPILTMQEGHAQGTFKLEGNKLTDVNTHKILQIMKIEKT